VFKSYCSLLHTLVGFQYTGVDSCTIVLITLPENITGVMTCSEHETGREHLHSLHLSSFNHYILKNVISSDKLKYYSKEV
jgi:hypothetical protein